MQKFGHTVINYNTLLIVNCTTQQQRYAHNVTLPSLYTVTQAQLAKLFKTATANQGLTTTYNSVILYTVKQ